MTDTHRWPRARAGHPDYGRVCGCGNLKDEQALRCRACYADERRDEDARTCECGGPKSRQSLRCRRCADKLLLGNQHAAGHAQPSDHPWRKPRVLSTTASAE